MKTKLEITVDGMDVAVRVLRLTRINNVTSSWQTVYRSQDHEEDLLRIRHAYFEGYDPKSLNGMEGRMVMAATVGWERMRQVARS